MTRIPGEQEDALIERAAIMAEGNGWSQETAERRLALSRGYKAWFELHRAARKADQNG